ncbi:MAG: hypothetical protein ABII68_04235 [Pseudomonadota bacterium]
MKPLPKIRDVIFYFRITGRLIPLLLLAMTFPCIPCASESPPPVSKNLSPAPGSWYDGIDAEWGGHFRVYGDASRPDEKSFLKPVGPDTYYNGAADLRLKNKTFLSAWGYFEIQYENILSGGDMRRALTDLERLFPGFDQFNLLLRPPINDDRRLMDFTKTISEGESYIWYHRLDRLFLTLQPSWGTVSVGRQALTWGNGLIFNPMDLFNPFSPTDIIRDYKVGDDMATVRFPVENFGDVQLVYVARRNLVNGDVEYDQSALAGKLHTAVGDTEFDAMAAQNYGDTIIGFGSRGYYRDAAWRLDATYTFLDDATRRTGFLSLVANMDYSWAWLGKNCHGLVEFYFNGLGDNNYPEALNDPDIYSRLVRGELFVLGRTYLSGEIQVELHPLLNFYLTVINNTSDPSGIIQPRAAWDLTENTQITAGANFTYGKTGSEYGGFKLLNSNYYYIPSNGVLIWLTRFF